jgi:hypothetical protein
MIFLPETSRPPVFSDLLKLWDTFFAILKSPPAYVYLGKHHQPYSESD